MSLTSNQRKSLASALTSAFPSESELARMVDYFCDQKLYRITESNSIDRMVFRLIEWAETRDESPRLIQNAFMANPFNRELHDFALSWARTEGKVEKVLLAALEEHPHNARLQEDLNGIFQELKTQIATLTNDLSSTEKQLTRVQQELQQIRQKAAEEIQSIQQKAKTETSTREQKVLHMTEWVVNLKNECELNQQQIIDLKTDLESAQQAKYRLERINRVFFHLTIALEVSLAVFIGVDSLTNGTLFPWLNRHWSDFGSMALSATVFFAVILLLDSQWRSIF